MICKADIVILVCDKVSDRMIDVQLKCYSTFISSASCMLVTSEFPPRFERLSCQLNDHMCVRLNLNLNMSVEISVGGHQCS